MKQSVKIWSMVASVMAGLATGASVAAAAVDEGEGTRYVSGGVGQSERARLHAERGQYNLWVTTVAKPSGAYLSDAKLEVFNTAQERLVLADDMAGPWLFANLPAGHYRVIATVRLDSGATASRTKSVTVEPGVLRQVVFRFHSAAQVSDQRSVQFGGNPFSQQPR